MCIVYSTLLQFHRIEFQARICIFFFKLLWLEEIRGKQRDIKAGGREKQVQNIVLIKATRAFF